MEEDRPIRCLLDVVELPPATFAMPEDGRQRAHKSRQRKALVVILAKHANPDGSRCYPSTKTMAAAMGLSERAVYRLLQDLRALGFLTDGARHAIHKTVIRKLNVSKMTTLTSSPGTPDILEPSPLTSSRGPLTSSQAPLTSSFVTQPPLVYRPENRSHTTARARSASSQNTFSQVARYLHEDMLASQWKKDEKRRADALIAEYGFEKFLACEKLYWQTQDPNNRTIFRWTAFLDGFQGWLAKVTPAQLQAMADERWRKDNPEEYQRQQQASVDRQMRESMQRDEERLRDWRARTNEADVSELL